MAGGQCIDSISNCHDPAKTILYRFSNLMLKKLNRLFRSLFNIKTRPLISSWNSNWSLFLQENVTFYSALTEIEKETFNQRIQLFWQTTSIESEHIVVTDQDCLFVAASAIIPVWSFSGWHYFNLKSVYLMPATFNQDFQCGQPDSLISGMVGSGVMAGKMVLSKPALHQGFKNHRDKQNVGIHEFVHLIDMMDGECDGFPERLKEYAFTIPWFELAGHKIREIQQRSSNIRDYGATNRAEFFAVASEYFFERPAMLERKHPELYQALSEFYKQDLASIDVDVKPMKNSPCPCGSGKKYKRCCMPAA